MVLAAAHTFAGDEAVIEAGKKKVARDFRELQAPQFRNLQVRYAHDGKPALLCGEINGKNKPEFVKFWVRFDRVADDNRRPVNFPEKIWDELVDAVCTTDL